MRVRLICDSHNKCGIVTCKHSKEHGLIKNKKDAECIHCLVRPATCPLLDSVCVPTK